MLTNPSRWENTQRMPPTPRLSSTEDQATAKTGLELFQPTSAHQA